MTIHTVKFNGPVYWTDQTGISFVNVTTAETTTTISTATPQGSEVIEYDVTWVADPAYLDVVEWRIASDANYMGDKIEPASLELINCLGPALKDDSSYDSVQASLTGFQSMKVATAATYLRITSLTQPIELGFGDTASDAETSLQPISVDGGYLVYGACVAWKAVSTEGTFRIEQTKAV